MNEVYLRLVDVVRQETFEVRFDSRLSLHENFVLLKQMTGRDYENCEVYMPDKKIFLDRNISLAEYGSAGFVCLHLFYSD